MITNQVISNTGIQTPCSAQETIYGGESYHFSPLETPSALCPPQEAGFTLNLSLQPEDIIAGNGTLETLQREFPHGLYLDQLIHRPE